MWIGKEPRHTEEKWHWTKENQGRGSRAACAWPDNRLPGQPPPPTPLTYHTPRKVTVLEAIDGPPFLASTWGCKGKKLISDRWASFGFTVFWYKVWLQRYRLPEFSEKVSAYLLCETPTFSRYDQVGPIREYFTIKAGCSANRVTQQLHEEEATPSEESNQRGQREASHFRTLRDQTVRRCSPLYIFCIYISGA